MMRSDAWPQHCRAALVRSVSAAAAQFPGPGEEAPKRVHDVRKTLKEARAIARLFLDCVGEPARVTITTLAATRRQIGRARDLDVMALRVQRLEPPPEVSEPLMAAIAREREAAQRARRGLAATAPRPRLNAIVRRVEGWDLSAVGTEEIVAAVARTYRQARKRGRLAFDGDDPVALHAFRARVVDLRYQLSLLSCAWPEALNAQAEASERSSRGARRLQRSPCARNVRGGTRRVAAAGAGRPRRPHGGEAEKAQAARQCGVRAAVRRNAERVCDPHRGLSQSPRERAGGRGGRAGRGQGGFSGVADAPVADSASGMTQGRSNKRKLTGEDLSITFYGARRRAGRVRNGGRWLQLTTTTGGRGGMFLMRRSSCVQNGRRSDEKRHIGRGGGCPRGNGVGRSSARRRRLPHSRFGGDGVSERNAHARCRPIRRPLFGTGTTPDPSGSGYFGLADRD